MKQRKVWRYICEHCSKGYFKPKKCLDHEKKCVKNPDRTCGMCERYELGQRTADEILNSLNIAARLSGIEWDYDVEGLRDMARGCPMCMLAVTMLLNKRFGFGLKHEDAYIFSYHEEMGRFEKKREPECPYENVLF